MPNQLPFSQYDVNKSSGQNLQTIFRQLNLVLYDGMKFVVGFLRSMFKMFLGK